MRGNRGACNVTSTCELLFFPKVAAARGGRHSNGDGNASPLPPFPPSTPHIHAGEVIVFASQRAKVEALVTTLTKQGLKVGGIHGDMDQVGGARKGR